MKARIISFLLFLALLWAPTAPVHAQSPDSGDVFLLGQDYTLAKGETLNGSLAIIGGNVLIEKGAIINGNVAVTGGNLSIIGDVYGDVAIIGGNLTTSGAIHGDIAVVGGQAVLTETAVVDGDLATIGGQIKQDPKAQISGDVTHNAPLVEIPQIPNAPEDPNTPNLPNIPTPNWDANPLWKMANVLIRAFAVGAIAMLLTLFLQPQLERTADAITRQPILSGSFGLLAVVATPLAILIMVVTLILIPAAVVVALLVPLAWLFGIVALGQEVGERLSKALNQVWQPVITSGMGTFLLILISGLIGIIPCIGWLFSLIVTLFAIGGVVMTWFGTRPTPINFLTPVEVPPAA
jgi:hypothetical protein